MSKDADLGIIDAAERDGYTVETEESYVGVRCFGVSLPFRPPASDGLSVAVPVSRLTGGRADNIIETLLSIKARLGSGMVRGHSSVR